MVRTTLYTFLQSPLGELLLTSCAGKLTGLYFTGRPHAPQIAGDWIRRDGSDLFRGTVRQLEEYAAGERQDFDVPLEFGGTAFQRRVWREIFSIPFGETRTYGEVAARLSAAEAVRAVGTATGRNPLCWIVPCHRVIGKNGTLTGYAGGLNRKQALLDFEAGKSSRLVPAAVEELVAA